jgi:hypothetical protein
VLAREHGAVLAPRGLHERFASALGRLCRRDDAPLIGERATGSDGGNDEPVGGLGDGLRVVGDRSGF